MLENKIKYKRSETDQKRVVDAFIGFKHSDLTLGINPKTAHKWLSNNQELPRKRGGKMSKQTNEKITRVITAIEKKTVGRNSS